MNPTQIAPPETAAMPGTALSELVAAVKKDPKGLTTSVQVSVQRSQEDDNSCMMGGWTA
jgi:hypothetical protein